MIEIRVNAKELKDIPRTVPEKELTLVVLDDRSESPRLIACSLSPPICSHVKDDQTLGELEVQVRNVCGQIVKS
jgi:hypothetical protein